MSITQVGVNLGNVRFVLLRSHSGDRIAQVALAGVTITSTEIYLASGQGALLNGINSIGNFIGYAMNRHTSAGHLSLFLLIVAGGLGVIVIRARGANSYAFWQRAVAVPSLVCFLSVTFLNCSGSSPGNNGTPWETTTGSTTGIPGVSTIFPTYNDATLAGMPVTGTFFLVPNHLGSTALVTDASGTSVISQLYYEPYGDVVESASSGPDIIRNKFTGHETDAESSLMYFGSRYYDSRLGRFISADSIVYKPDMANAHNRYMYVLGSPVNFTDPTGNWWFVPLLIAAATAYAADEDFRNTVNEFVSDAADWTKENVVEGLKDFAVGAVAYTNFLGAVLALGITLGVIWGNKIQISDWTSFYKMYREANWGVTIFLASGAASGGAGSAVQNIAFIKSLGAVATGTAGGAVGRAAGAAVKYVLTPDVYNHKNFFEEMLIGAATGAASGFVDGIFDGIARSELNMSLDDKPLRGSVQETSFLAYRTVGILFSGAAGQLVEDACRRELSDSGKYFFAGMKGAGQQAGLTLAGVGGLGFIIPAEISEGVRHFIGLQNSFEFDKKIDNAWSSIQNASIGR